jgi:hypothetical protein
MQSSVVCEEAWAHDLRRVAERQGNSAANILIVTRANVHLREGTAR